MQQKNGLRSTIKGAWCMSHTFLMQQWGPEAVSILFHAAVPVLLHLFGWRDLQWPNDAEPEKLRVGMVPDAFRQLRTLALPGFVGGAPGGAAEHRRRFVPGTAANRVRVR